MADDDDPDLLYEDLFENLENGQAVIKSSFLELEERIQEVNREKEDLKMQIDGLQLQNQKLTKQNEVLIRNISCLFKTAQMEIARKGKQIRSLQEEALRSNLNADRSMGGAVVHCQPPNARIASQAMSNSGRHMRKCSQPEELLESPFGLRKRMVCGTEDNRTPGEKGSNGNKRLQVEDRGSESLERSRLKSMEYNELPEGAQWGCENYLKPMEKEERASGDYQRMKPLVRSHDIDNSNCSSPVRGQDVYNGGTAGLVRSYDVDNANNNDLVNGFDVDDVNHNGHSGRLHDHHLRGHEVDNGNNGCHIRWHDGGDRNHVHVRGHNVDNRNRDVHVRARDDERNYSEHVRSHDADSRNHYSRAINAGEQGRKRRPDNYIKRVIDEEDWAARDQTRGSRARSQFVPDRRNDTTNGRTDINKVEECENEGTEYCMSRTHDVNSYGTDVIETKEEWRRGRSGISNNRAEEEARERRPRR